MVAPSVGREGTRLDCRHFGERRSWTVGAGNATQGAQRTWARGIEESEGREIKKKGRSSSSGQTVESCSSDEGLGREDESKVRRTAATKPGALLPLRLGHDAAPLGRQAVNAVQAKGLAAAYLATALKPNAGSRLSFGALRELQSLQSSAEAVDLLMRGRVASGRRRSDPEIPRSRSGVTGRRRMVSRTPSRSVVRSGSVDNVIWSSGSGREGRTGSSPAAPGSVET